MDAPIFNGPIDYTEVVYVMHCLGVAESIKRQIAEGAEVDPDAAKWALGWEWEPSDVPHVSLQIVPVRP